MLTPVNMHTLRVAKSRTWLSNWTPPPPRIEAHTHHNWVYHTPSASPPALTHTHRIMTHLRMFDLPCSEDLRVIHTQTPLISPTWLRTLEDRIYFSVYFCNLHSTWFMAETQWLFLNESVNQCGSLWPKWADRGEPPCRPWGPGVLFLVAGPAWSCSAASVSFQRKYLLWEHIKCEYVLICCKDTQSLQYDT